MSLNIVRKKYSKYTYLQRKLIYNEYISKKSIREISHKYNVPVSSIYKIKWENQKRTSLHNNRDKNLECTVFI